MINSNDEPIVNNIKDPTMKITPKYRHQLSTGKLETNAKIGLILILLKLIKKIKMKIKIKKTK